MKNEYQDAFANKLDNVLLAQPPAVAAEVREALRLAQKEMHREFRYAAIDKMQSVRERWMLTHNFPVAERMLDEMIGALHNLPLPTTQK